MTTRSKDSNPNTAVRYTRKITIPSITLNKDDFSTLISILEKSNKTPSFDIETGQESLTFTDIQSLGNEKWPTNIKQFGFSTGYFQPPEINGYIRNPDQLNFSSITLAANNRDWISARTDEFRRFLDQHRNRHYIFHNLRYTLPQGLLLFGLSAYWLITYFIQQDLRNYILFPVLASLYLIWALYGVLLPKVFPYLVLEPEQQSFYTGLRTALKVLIPSIFAGLILNAILISFP